MAVRHPKARKDPVQQFGFGKAGDGWLAVYAVTEVFRHATTLPRPADIVSGR
jgi:hypothetical protein